MRFFLAICAYTLVCGVIAVIVNNDKAKDTAQVIKDKVEDLKSNGIKKFDNQSVYVLVDATNGNEVKYVGRTNDPKRRADEHRLDPKKQGYEMIVIQTGIKTVEEARVAENIVIHAYSIEKALVNGRREIAVGKISGFRTYFSNVLELYGTVLEDEILNLMSYSPFNKMGR